MSEVMNVVVARDSVELRQRWIVAVSADAYYRKFIK